MLEKRLGRGLKNLISGGEPEEPGALELEINSIVPNRLQPRREFDPKAITELASSIAQYGLLQPIVVRKLGENRYELISGERRLRASKEAGLGKIPAVIRDPKSDREVLELAIVENLQRVDLDPMEKARGFRQLANEFGLTQEQVAERVGQERSTVANFLRLLDLPDELQLSVSRGTISMGHARALLGAPNKDFQLKALRQIIDGGLSVRATEGLIRDSQNLLSPESSKRRKQPLKPSWLAELEGLFERQLGSKVRISHKKGKGKIHIEYSSDEELNHIAKRMGALGGGNSV